MIPRKLQRCLLVFPLLLTGAAGGGAAEDERPAGFESLRIIQTMEPKYPNQPRLVAMREGEVTVIISVDAEGRLKDWLVIRHTDPAFAQEALTALLQWRFEPARRQGQPVAVRTEVTFSFHATGQLVTIVSPDQQFNSHLRSDLEARVSRRVCSAAELDQPLEVLQVVQPMPPGQLGAQRREGRAQLDFYVDEEGRPRMPVVLRADDDAFGKSAVHAVLDWRFTPPTRRGVPVVAHVKQEFVFKAQE